MGKISQRKARVGSGEFLVDDGAGNGVKSGAAVILGCADAQQTEFAHASQQFKVEFLITVVFKRLRFNVFLGPLTDHFTQHLVLFARIRDVHVGHDDASPRWLLTFGKSGNGR